jgi:hypothetical protein
VSAKLDVLNVPKAADALLGRLENPRHRAIVANFRRHALLEVSGRWREILTPEMTVAHPVYRIVDNGQTLVFDGIEEVRGFYRGMTEAGLNVFGPIEERLAVDDWGLAAEALFAQIMPGHVLVAQGEDVDDPDAHYLFSHRISMAWPYDDDAKLIGENVYEDPSTRTIEKLDPADVVTPQQAAALLAPLLEERR